MRKGCWLGLLVGVAFFGLAGPASAGTYDVVSCGAPGAGGVNKAWTVYPGFDDRFWEIKPSCPDLTATSEPRAGVVAPFFTGAGYHAVAPSGAILDKMVIWRHGYRFNSTGTAQGPWTVGGFRGDGTVIGGPLFGETCNVPSNQLFCEFGAPGTAAAAQIERDLETNEVLYSVSCFGEGGCATANAEGFPFAAVSVSGSVITVRDEGQPSVVARGPLLEPGWRTDDASLSFGVSDPVGVREARVLVDGSPVHTVQPPCDFRAMAPCGQVPERSVALGAGLPDGVHTVSVEATDTAGNVARVDRQVSADRDPPAIAFAPSRGRGRKVVVDAPDAGSGTVSGAIAIRRRGRFRALRTVLRGGRLIARLGGTRAGRTFRATATDALGRTAQIIGAPVRLRAGFGRRLREGINGGPRGRPLVRGRLRAWGGGRSRGSRSPCSRGCGWTARARRSRQPPRPGGGAGSACGSPPARAARCGSSRPATAACRPGCSGCGIACRGRPR